MLELEKIYFYLKEEALKVYSFLKKELSAWEINFKEINLSSEEKVLHLVFFKNFDLLTYFVSRLIEKLYCAGCWDLYVFYIDNVNEEAFDIGDFLGKFFYLVKKRVYQLGVFNYLNVNEVLNKYEEYKKKKKEIEMILKDKEEAGIKFFCQVLVDDRERVSGYEILSRLENFQGYLISSANFFYVLEREKRLFLNFEELVFKKVVKEIKTNKVLKDFIKNTLDKKINVNFSMNFLINGFDVFKFYRSVLKDWIIIEVNEKDFIETVSEGVEAVRKLKELGYFVVLDDFGEGKNNFDRLFVLDYCGIKMGMFFSKLVKDMLREVDREDIRKKFLFEVVRDLVYQIKLYDEDFYICFEGIEDESVFKVVKNFVNAEKKYQGFLFGRPFLIEEKIKKNKEEEEKK